MYKTHPKSTIFLVLLPLIAAFVLPAVLTFPNFAQTAAGLQVAMLLWAAMGIRMVLMPEAEHSWLDAVRIPMLIIAAVAALGYVPQDGLGDFARQVGRTALMVGLGSGAAWISPRFRPKTLGFTFDRNFALVLFTIILLLIWNHGFRLAGAQGAALFNDLVVIALFANVVFIGQVQSNGDWAVRLMAACSFCIYIGSIVFYTNTFWDGAFDPMASFAIFAVQVLVVGLMSPCLERWAAGRA